MSTAPIHSLRSSFSPIRHYARAYAPIARVERSVDLLGAPPARMVTYQTRSAEALSGPSAAQIADGPSIPLYAPGARFDAYA